MKKEIVVLIAAMIVPSLSMRIVFLGTTTTVGNKTEPVEDKTEPVKDKTEPVHDKREPVQDKIEPVENKTEPVKNKTEPVEDNTDPVQAKTGHVQDIVDPFQNLEVDDQGRGLMQQKAQKELVAFFVTASAFVLVIGGMAVAWEKFTARRIGALSIVILAVCVCSIGLSVFYVHSVQLSPGTDHVFYATAGKEWRLKRRNWAVDDDGGIGASADAGLKPPFRSVAVATLDVRSGGNANTGSAQSLKDINNAVHINGTKNLGQNENFEANVESKNKRLPDGQAVRDRSIGNVISNKPNGDLWPTHEERPKTVYKVNHISNPSYEKPVRTRRDWNGERYIVYLCHNDMMCAGWGDRQHGIFSAYLISLVTNRTFKVDMTSPCPLTKLYHPRIANWKVEPAEFEGLSSTHLYAMNDRGFRDAMKRIDFNYHFPQDVVYLTTNYDYYFSLKANPYHHDVFHKKVRHRPRPILFADLWQFIFKHNRRVTRRYTPVLDAARVSKTHRLVCAHIRFGRNPSIPNDSQIRNTLSSIEPLWSFLKQYSDPNKYRLFVASDWEGFRDKVNKHYKNMTVNMEGKVIHIDQYAGDKSCGQQSCDKESEVLCNGLEMVIADQHVLSQCDILLLTYSVFGKSAAYLRRSNKDLYLMDKGKISSLTLFKEQVVKKL